MQRIARTLGAAIVAGGCASLPAAAQHDIGGRMDFLPAAREVNRVAEPPAGKTVVIAGATLFDGRGAPPVRDAVVVVRGGRILAVGPRDSVEIPAGAEIVDAAGQSVLPGLVDAHFHLDGDIPLPALFLRRGVTSLRDPGAWIEGYDPVRASAAPIPRLFLTGPHLDAPPPAHPSEALLVLDPAEARVAVHRLADRGASAIKIYYRLPLGTIRAVNEAAHERGLITMAHLEIVDAADAVRAGTDGIEHVTSFGTAIAAPREAEAFRQAVLADNAARGPGRYALWSDVDLDSPRVKAVLDLLASEGTFFTPTLAVYERRPGDPGTSEVEARAFSKMLAFVGRARGAGVRIAVGSHSAVPHAERGDAYFREMELLHEAGLPRGEVIAAATLETARFLRIQDRLGSLEPGKIADLILVGGDPGEGLSALRDVRRVMLNGVWVAPR
ncbi:amidohydrolase family protein [Polyangium spumosum]|nr:amidohydrolase family protein [Polyangium spumosum]